MKQRSLLRRILEKLRGTKPADSATAAAKQAPTEQPRRKRTESSCEPLEGRIAPAVLLNASTVQFTDTDGDLVTVQFSKALFKGTPVELENTLAAVFKFKDGGEVLKPEDGGLKSQVHELAMLDLAIL